MAAAQRERKGVETDRLERKHEEKEGSRLERENVDQPGLKIYASERQWLAPVLANPSMSDAFILENAPRTFCRNLERINMDGARGRSTELEAATAELITKAIFENNTLVFWSIYSEKNPVFLFISLLPLLLLFGTKVNSGNVYSLVAIRKGFFLLLLYHLKIS